MMRLAAILACAAAACMGGTRDERPNILWIYVDDMSDWVGCYGDKTVPTPHIDSLAEAGIRFEHVT